MSDRLAKQASFLFFLLLFAMGAHGLKLEFVSQVTFSHKMKFEKTKIGGLSALWFDKESSSLYVLSDDRGTVDEPRFYKFHLEVKDSHLEVTPKAVVFIQKKIVKKSTKSSVLDMEGMAQLPWGNFLISSEGDNNQKPRIPPEILDVKKDGTWIRNFEIPGKFIPEATGEQHKGIRNNTGFEGLTTWSEKKLVWAWNEGPLVQDSPEDWGPLRVVRYEMPEAWVIKPTQEFVYLPEPKQVSDLGLVLGAKVSEALAVSEHDFLVLERAVKVSTKEVGFRCQIYLASLAGADDVSSLESLKGKDLGKLKKISKTLILDLESIKDKLGGSIDNFEGMSFGPLIDGKKTIIVVSDDNFKKIQKTQFVLFKMIE
jgi:3-phytase